MPSGKVNWYDNDVILAVENATDEILTQLAFWIEGEAKPPPCPVDTGFMRNAIYAIGPERDHRSKAESEARGAADRPMAPMPQVGEHKAAIHGAAEYTVFQEMIHGFLYGALQRAQKQAPGVIREVGRERL
jgi:hypothetical protein